MAKLILFTVPDELAPALRSAIEEISNEIGERLVGNHRFDKEEALTRAAAMLGRVRSAFYKVGVRENEDAPYLERSNPDYGYRLAEAGYGLELLRAALTEAGITEGDPNYD